MSILTQLPNEILDYIFQFLSVSDKSVLSRTCRALNCAISKPATSTVTLGEKFNADRVMDSLKSNGCEINKFVFITADLQQEQPRVEIWESFWTAMGVNVTSLEFRNCQVSEKTFLGIIHRCPHLTSLVIDNCNSLLMSGKLLDTYCMDVPLAFRSLNHLEVINSRYLSDSLFNRFVAYEKSITKLSVAGCPISFHSAIFKRFYPANGSVLASESVLTFQNILKCVEKHANSLKSLDLSRTLIDDQALIALSQIKQLVLDEIILSNCYQISKNGIRVLCHHQPKLKIINLTQGIKLCDHALIDLTNLTPLVEKLVISECCKFSDSSFKDINKLKNIRELDISSCQQVTGLGLKTALLHANMKNLTSLNISACSVSQDVIVAISANLNALRHLDMSNCCDGVTDVALQAVSSNLRRLRTLKLAWCKNLTDFGLTGRHYILPEISSNPSPLPSPTIPLSSGTWASENTDNQKINIATLSPDSNSSQNLCLSRLQGLTHLDLCGCAKITDISLKVAIQFRELVYLNLSLCEKITDRGLASVGACNGSLESLKLSQCRNLTDSGVIGVVKCLPRLKHLDIQGCQRIGNESVEAVENSCPGLRFLDVSICPGIAANTLSKLEMKRANLHINQRQLNYKYYIPYDPYALVIFKGRIVPISVAEHTK